MLGCDFIEVIPNKSGHRPDLTCVIKSKLGFLVCKSSGNGKLYNLFAGCLRTETLLDYLHNKLTCEEVEVVKKHLDKCPRYAEELKFMKESENQDRSNYS